MDGLGRSQFRLTHWLAPGQDLSYRAIAPAQCESVYCVHGTGGSEPVYNGRRVAIINAQDAVSYFVWGPGVPSGRHRKMRLFHPGSARMETVALFGEHVKASRHSMDPTNSAYWRHPAAIINIKQNDG